MKHAHSWRLLLAACLMSLAGPTRAPAQQAQGELLEARRALDHLDVERADRLLELLSSQRPADPRVLAQLGRLRLHQGRYDDATRALARSLALSPARADHDWRPGTLELARATREATADFVQERSADGRYVVLHPAGEQALLAPYALETLRRADQALRRELGGHAPIPLRLEIYASPEDLARVSPLTVEEIETSGTIALSKWDRLMITSPRALIRGYPWRDTINHELAHLLLARSTQNRAPVWLQEGVAKLLERTWRQPLGSGELDPASRGLLYEAARGGTLIPFSRLHPSIALLPSQRQAALAFAEVTSFVGGYRSRLGPGCLEELAARLRAGDDARAAMGAASGSSFEELETEWRRSLRRQAPADPNATPGFIPLRFRRGGSQADTDDVQDVQARRRVRLGDMLSEAGRAQGARVEYEAALELAPHDPAVAWRLARAALASGAAERAQAVLQGLALRAPEFEPVRAWLAQAHRAQGQLPAAAREARAAVGLNPFDPLPHCVLAEAAEDASERRQEGDSCRSLR